MCIRAGAGGHVHGTSVCQRVRTCTCRAHVHVHPACKSVRTCMGTRMCTCMCMYMCIPPGRAPRSVLDCTQID